MHNRIVTAIADVDRRRLAAAIYEEGSRRSSTPTIMLPGRAPARAVGTPTYGDAAAQGIDTIAEVTLARLGLKRQSVSYSDRSFLKFSVPDVDTMLGLVAEARLRVVSAADDRVVFEQTYVRQSPRYARFTEWARDNAAPLRDDCDAVLHALALEIADELFGAEPSPANQATRLWASLGGRLVLRRTHASLASLKVVPLRGEGLGESFSSEVSSWNRLLLLGLPGVLLARVMLRGSRKRLGSHRLTQSTRQRDDYRPCLKHCLPVTPLQGGDHGRPSCSTGPLRPAVSQVDLPPIL